MADNEEKKEEPSAERDERTEPAKEAETRGPAGLRPEAENLSGPESAEKIKNDDASAEPPAAPAAEDQAAPESNRDSDKRDAAVNGRTTAGAALLRPLAYLLVAASSALVVSIALSTRHEAAYRQTLDGLRQSLSKLEIRTRPNCLFIGTIRARVVHQNFVELDIDAVIRRSVPAGRVGF